MNIECEFLFEETVYNENRAIETIKNFIKKLKREIIPKIQDVLNKIINNFKKVMLKSNSKSKVRKYSNDSKNTKKDINSLEKTYDTGKSKSYNSTSNTKAYDIENNTFRIRLINDNVNQEIIKFHNMLRNTSSVLELYDIDNLDIILDNDLLQDTTTTIYAGKAYEHAFGNRADMYNMLRVFNSSIGKFKDKLDENNGVHHPKIMEYLKYIIRVINRIIKQYTNASIYFTNVVNEIDAI